MERSSEYDDIAVALAEMRPAPRADFATELDELVAAGFPRKSRFARLQPMAARVRGLSPQRLLVASGAAGLAAIAIATVMVTSDSRPGPVALEQHAAIQPRAAKPPVQFSQEVPRAPGRSKESAAASGSAETLRGFSTSLSDSNASYTPLSLSRATHRDIERSAEISLLADPADVAEDSAKVFSAVHDVRGIVLRSTTTAGRNSGAHFDLLIPSAKLGDALAAFSVIDEVRSRHETTADITKPTIAANEELQDSRARIDSLLAQLSTAELESEREAIEAELRGERRHAARLRSQVARLHQRADFSRVSLRIETGPPSDTSGGSWGIDDAFGDAGHILGIVAGVTVVGLAVVAPLVLLCLLAWLAHHIWLRSRRERALDA
ncbi:MAG TPA: DUF4349 domain-containing protein [Solirubrobacterales bacterium]